MTDLQKNRDNKKKKKQSAGYNYDYSGNRKKYIDGRDRTGHRTIVRLVKLVDVLIVSVPFYVAWIVYYSHMLYIKDFYRRGNWVVMGLYTVLYYLLAHLYSGYSIHISRISEIIYSQSLGALMTNSIMFVIMWLLIRHVPSIPVLLVVLCVQVAFIITWAELAHIWYFKNNPPIPTAVIYDEMEGVEKLVSHYGLDKHFKIVKKVSIHELHGENWDSLTWEEKDNREKVFIRKVLKGVDAVFLSSLHSHDRNQIIKIYVAIIESH